MTETSLINLGELSKPATVLIEKVSAAVGGIFKPYQIIRVAKAEAEAERIRAEGQIEITDLHRRAMHRFLEEEATKQLNMEEITQEALPLLGAGSSPEKVEDDWITNFFDKCRIVSDDDMQHLWSRVLAGEANSPGAFSKRTVNLLADLEKSDAELFTKLCGFGWNLEDLIPLVFDFQDNVYNREGIEFISASHLESLGLVQVDVSGFLRSGVPKRFAASYFGSGVELTLPKESDNVVEVGNVLLTRAGHELARVCSSVPVDGFFEFVYDRWADLSYLPKREAEKVAPEGG